MKNAQQLFSENLIYFQLLKNKKFTNITHFLYK